METVDDEGPNDEKSQRLDKWLWFARFAKTRSIAQRLIQDGRVRVNRERTVKPAHTVRVGDLVSVEIAKRLMLLEVLAPGARRGSASEAAHLYRDLAPPPPRSTFAATATNAPTTESLPARDPGAGRPTKLERRRIDRLRNR